MKNFCEPRTITIKDTSPDLTKVMMETSIRNSKALEKLNDKFLEILNDRGIMASYLKPPIPKFANPRQTSRLKVLKDPHTNRVIDLLINKAMPVNLYNNLLIFPDTLEKFKVQGELLKMVTNKNFIVKLDNLPDEKLLYEFAKEL